MTKESFIQEIEKYMSQNILSQEQPIASIRVDDKIFITSKGFASTKEIATIDLTSGDVIDGDPVDEYKRHIDIYTNRKNENAILYSNLAATKTCSIVGKTVYPMLDDMAQIVGPSAKVACKKSKNCTADILKKLKGRKAVLIKGKGAICCSATLDDASVVAIVLDKGCKSTIESAMIGGGKKINYFESLLMHIVYTLKYSKQNIKNK